MILKPQKGQLVVKGHPMSIGMVFNLPMNEGDGITIFDASGNGTNGVFAGGSGVPTWKAGKFGSSLNFVAANTHYIELANVGLLTDYPFSIVVWFKSSTTSGQTLVGIADFGVANKRHLLMIGRGGSSNNASAATQNTTFVEAIGTTNVCDGNSHCIAGVWSSATSREIFVDGIFENQETTDVTWFNPTRLSIGVSPDISPSAYMNGDIELGMFTNRALTAGEIALLYREPFHMFERDPIELWVGSVGAGAAGTILPQITSAYMRI